MRGFSIKGKLLLTSGLTLVMVVILMLGGWYANNHMSKHRAASVVFDQEVMSLQILLRGLNEMIITEGSSTASIDMVKTATADFDTSLTRAGTLFQDNRSAAEIYTKAVADWAELKPGIEAFLKMKGMGTGDDDSMLALGKLVSQADKLVGHVRGLSRETLAHVQKEVDRVLLAVTAFGLGMLVLLFALFVWVYRNVSRPIQHLRNTLVDVRTSRDLTQRVNLASRDEIGEATGALDDLLQSLHGLIRDFVQTIARVEEQASHLRLAAEHGQEGALQQDDATQQVVGAVEELNQRIADIATQSSRAVEVAAIARTQSERGTRALQEALGAISSTLENTERMSVRIDGLSQQSQKISVIASTIHDIADQTNLLALNAAIEAARAGEQGRGFAVVADEVRKLAERTTLATQEISGVIGSIQHEIEAAVDGMGRNRNEARRAHELVETTGEVLVDIDVSVRDTNGVIVQIADSTALQSRATGEITRHVERIARMTAEESSTIAKTLAAAKDLDTLSVELHQGAARFRV